MRDGGMEGTNGTARAMNDLDETKKAGVQKESTTIIDGAYNAAAIKAGVESIREQAEEATSEYDEEKRPRPLQGHPRSIAARTR